MEALNIKKRVRDDSDELTFKSVEVKRLRDDLLDMLEDSELCSAPSQDLDLFIKSFEEEISAKSSPVVDLTSDSSDGESRPELGYLFGASDDELGLPPTESENPVETGFVRVFPELSEFWMLDDQISSYDEFGYGYVDGSSNNSYNGEYEALDGLFDYTDLGFGSSDLS